MNPSRGPSAESVVVLRSGALAALSLLILGCGGGSSTAAPPTPAPVAVSVRAEQEATPSKKQVDEDVDELLKRAEALAVKAPKPPARAANEVYTPRRLVEVPVDRARLVGKKSAELWMTSDAGRTWINQGEIDSGKVAAGFLAPRDGRYGFMIVPLSAAGVRETTPKPGDAPDKTVVVDTVAPVVEVRAPNGGEMFGVGRSTVVQWIADDANLHPEGLLVEASADSGATWVTVQKGLPNSGSYHWDIHFASSARCRVRVKAVDLAGNVGSDTSDRDFGVDGQPPDLKITGPSTAREVPVLVDWTGGDPGGSGLKRVTLYVTRDRGQTWAPSGEDPGLASPFSFKDLDGVYGLMLVGEDRMGNAPRAPVAGTPAPFTMILDRTRPEVKLHSPQGGGVFGGVAVDIRWTAKDNLDMPRNGVALLHSPDDGKTWVEIKRALPNEGLHTWIPPRTAGKDSRIKAVATDSAGNEGVAVSDRFGIDLNVPEARATGPDRSRSHSVQVAYEIQNRGSAPIRKVSLYYRPEHVKEWLHAGDDSDNESPILFAKADGRYGLYVICSTDAGGRSEFHQKPPGEGVEPQVWLTIDATPPQLSLESFNGGGYLMAGASMEITWKMVEPNPDPRGMEIHHSPDGGTNWNVVAQGVDPTKGSHRWVVPNSHGARHKIRLTCADRFGNANRVESEKPFTVDNDLPVMTILERPAAVVRSSRLSARYKATDHTSGIERVVLYGKKLGTKDPYKELSQNRQPEGTIECDMPGEGTWACLVVAYDAAGHASADPARDSKADFVAGFDVTKPVVEIKYTTLPQGTRTCLNGNWEIEWTAKDNASPADKIGIRIEHSSDGGKTWFVAVARHPNTGKADMRAYFVAGKKYRVRLVATDEAGNEAEEQSADIDSGDVPLPSLALRGVEEGRAYMAGSTVNVMWSTPDRSVREAVIEISKDGGRTWSLLAQMSTTSMKITLPEKAGRYHLRALARDSVNRPVSSNYIRFDTIEGVEPVRIVTNATVAPAKLLRVLVEPQSIVRTAKELRLEISDDAMQWRKVADVRTTDLSFLAPAVAGEYVLRVAVKAPDGREYDSNHVRFKVTGKEASQGLQLQTFRGGDVYAGDRGRIIVLKTAVNLKEVTVEFSDAGGRDGTWKEVSREFLEPVHGGLHWKRLPGITKTTCRLRVTYKDAGGAVLKDESEKDFSIDSTRPVARVLGPAVETPIPVLLAVQIDASISPVRQVTLYVRKGTSWEVHDTFAQPGAIRLSLPESGDYGVYLVARSEAGLAGEPPVAGTQPQMILKARGKGDAPPVSTDPLALQTEIKEVIKGGAPLDLAWSGQGEGRVRLSLVIDGKPTLIKDELPVSGTYRWAVPKSEARNCRILLELGDRKASSKVFSIKSRPPEIKDAEIELPNR